MTTASHASTPDQPTELCPEVGKIRTAFSPGELYLLSAAERWIEDGTHVVRSLEYDLTVEGDDWDDAIQAFIEQSFEYLVLLAELVESGEATPGEHRAFDVLGSRAAKIVADEERRRERRRGFRLRKGRHSSGGQWQGPSTPRNSSTLPSVA